MELTFEDALRIARGCTDYGGGHRCNDEHYEIYQHGIQTVINALTAASKTGLDDTQTRALHSMGANTRLDDTAAAIDAARAAKEIAMLKHPAEFEPIAWRKNEKAEAGK